ncbi:MAG: peptidylprolyl isomerase, partial [Planctomycetota bacterium]|nr:peptidylprolyl isomerase [Planctomycetota bacterium]
MSALLTLLAPVLLAPGTPTVSWQSAENYISGRSFAVTLTVETGAEPGSLPAWMLGPGAFSVAGKPLAARAGGELSLVSGSRLELAFDLGPALASLALDGSFTLELAGADAARTITPIKPVESGIDFLTMAPADLAKYQVVMETSQGTMRIETWPDVAPVHSANFLDLSATGFYDGLGFHRCIPGFMIQGGDPTGTGAGNGPRKLPAEFNDRKHVRGVLSAARMGHDINSASCQFFVMHATYPSLDGQYTAFGKVLSGEEV